MNSVDLPVCDLPNPSLAQLNNAKQLLSVSEGLFSSVEGLIQQQNRLNALQNTYYKNQIEHQTNLQKILTEALTELVEKANSAVKISPLNTQNSEPAGASEEPHEAPMGIEEPPVLGNPDHKLQLEPAHDEEMAPYPPPEVPNALPEQEIPNGNPLSNDAQNEPHQEEGGAQPMIPDQPESAEHAPPSLSPPAQEVLPQEEKSQDPVEGEQPSPEAHGSSENLQHPSSEGVAISNPPSDQQNQSAHEESSKHSAPEGDDPKQGQDAQEEQAEQPPPMTDALRKIDPSGTKDTNTRMFLLFFFENKNFINHEFNCSNNSIECAKKAGDLWRRFDSSQKEIYKTILRKLEKDPLPDADPHSFVGIQKYKHALGMPVIEDPKMIRIFMGESASQEGEQKDQGSANDKELKPVEQDQLQLEEDIERMSQALNHDSDPQVEFE